jgi:nitronate monooxygenase
MSHTKIPKVLQGLRLPIISAPMFIVSYPELVLAQCKAGIVGSFPALNARTPEILDSWLTQMKDDLKRYQDDNPNTSVGPIAVNQIVHVSNKRLEQDMLICIKHQVPIYITSLRAPIKELIDAVHSYGGIVLHDVINVRHAQKALEAGVDGLIVVAAGAGGHAGTLSPFALVGEIRDFYDGVIVLSGAISTGQAVLAAQVIGADFAYLGTRFIASQEAHASNQYKDAIVDAHASDIVYTDYFTGIHGNYIQQSILNAGLDPEKLTKSDTSKLDLTKSRDLEDVKVWRDIWGAGQGVGLIKEVLSVSEIVNQLEKEYFEAKNKIISN